MRRGRGPYTAGRGPSPCIAMAGAGMHPSPMAVPATLLPSPSPNGARTGAEFTGSR